RRSIRRDVDPDLAHQRPTLPAERAVDPGPADLRARTGNLPAMRQWPRALRAGERRNAGRVTEAAPTGTKRLTGLAAYRLVVIAFLVIVTGAAAIFLGAPAFVCACSSTAPPARPSTSVPPSPVVGVVVFIDQESLTKVKSFDVRTPDGKTVTLKVGVLDNATQF